MNLRRYAAWTVGLCFCGLLLPSPVRASEADLARKLAERYGQSGAALAADYYESRAAAEGYSLEHLNAWAESLEHLIRAKP